MWTLLLDVCFPGVWGKVSTCKVLIPWGVGGPYSTSTGFLDTSRGIFTCLSGTDLVLFFVYMGGILQYYNYFECSERRDLFLE